MTSRPALGPLNIGNVVTTGFSLFKSNFSQYLKLEALAHFWVIVPIILVASLIAAVVAILVAAINSQIGVLAGILLALAGLIPIVYGFAKFAMYQGLIARLAFGQLTNQPETAVEARRSIQDRLWNFLAAAILVSLCATGVYFAGAIVVFIGAIIVAVLAATLGPAIAILGIVLGIIAVIALVAGLAWIAGRLFVTEMPIAVETERVDPTVALGNSWRLTQAAATRVMAIVFIAALVTFPLSLLINLGIQLPSVFLPEDSPLIALIVLVSYALSIVVNMVTLPFWQCIKAATYYDLRARKEGLDIQLRDRPI